MRQAPAGSRGSIFTLSLSSNKFILLLSRMTFSFTSYYSPPYFLTYTRKTNLTRALAECDVWMRVETGRARGENPVRGVVGERINDTCKRPVEFPRLAIFDVARRRGREEGRAKGWAYERQRVAK